jgi:hypothetical protein
MCETGITEFDNHDLDFPINRLAILGVNDKSLRIDTELIISEISNFYVMEDTYWKQVKWDNMMDDDFVKKTIIKIIALSNNCYILISLYSL